jgi:uncharacterized protein YdeI (YjbR/CyaY-like superfamily)
MAIMIERLFRTTADWRAWLAENHDREKEIWVVYYKKGRGKKSLTYIEALEEALCFGWIDSTVRRLDEDRYKQRYTPRNADSVWSALNKARIAKLIASGRMAEPGLRKIKEAKKNGSWTRLDPVERSAASAPELLEALAKHPKASGAFEKLPPSQKKLWSWWIISAKKAETRVRRIAAALVWIEAGRRIGMQAPRLSSGDDPQAPDPAE